MGTFGKTLSLMGFAIGVVVSILVYAQYSQTQSEVMSIVSDRMQSMPSTDFYVEGQEEQPPTLSVAKVTAPKSSSGVRQFEIEHVEAPAQTGSVIIYDNGEGAGSDPATEVEVTVEKTLPESASFGEKITFYFGRVSAWLFGEREEKVEMSCRPKAGGGKVCTVTRS
ncbi:hypothetical protein [Celeribacter neptunius]|uniref:Uncharacterized protein n=1 Tax=Celeribacter neptunius TaxID=588602 RepID=A0A1I3QGB5_9RHOB|nr:hypothetical protein [Celeribacter neptunius]SFJ32407.1 hypothetical protein SAMN04487991_1807 [Celeribacter neptunius]